MISASVLVATLFMMMLTVRSEVTMLFPAETMSVHVRSYPNGILRLQLVPTDGSQFYEVSDVLVVEHESNKFTIQQLGG